MALGVAYWMGGGGPGVGQAPGPGLGPAQLMAHAGLAGGLIDGLSAQAPRPAPEPAEVAAGQAQDRQPEQPRGEPADEPAPAVPPAPAPGVAIVDGSQPNAAAQPGIAPPPAVDPLGRRLDDGVPTKLSFSNVPVGQVIPFIVEATGKVVLPQTIVLTRTITVLNDRQIPRSRALDLVFLALQQAGVAVVETPELIFLRDQTDIDRESLPVLGPDVSVLTRSDVGAIVQKVFLLRNANAANLGELLEDSIPEYAKIVVDADSNQLLITGPIVYLQRMEQVLTALDRPATAALQIETFPLIYADADAIAENLRELYSTTSNNNARGGNAQAQGGNRQTQQPQQGRAGGGAQNFQFPGFFGQNAQQQGGAVTSTNFRVTANTQQNSVTVLAESPVIEQIRRQIQDEWDLPLPEEAVIPRVYDLKNTDPVRVRDLLQGLFGSSAGSTATANPFAGFGGGGGGGAAQRAGASQGAGRLAGQFSFQAIPEAGRLVVVAKSPDNLAVIDQIIAELDQPVTGGLPEVIDLKHASAEDLAEQLNALLAQDGTLAQVRRQESELSPNQPLTSPFSDQGATDGAATDGGAADGGAADSNITFWWQRSRPPTDNAGSSNLVSKARIVPVARQNAVMVLAPAEFKPSIIELVHRLDRPGRQVLISAVIAELSSDDTTSVGFRFSNAPLSTILPDNIIGINSGVIDPASGGFAPVLSGTQAPLVPGLFNTSVLNLGVDVQGILQALSQKTDVRVLSEPRIFTADNQEAQFFDGQDIPFITDSQTTDVGALNQAFEYRAVGIVLRVRPRITPERNVDLSVNLQLSSIDPSATLFGGFIVDRRETTTQLIVQDGQTVVISGIIRSEDTDVRRKVPLLGDIPLIGPIFQSVDRIKSNTELVTFITPIVIENPVEQRRLNEPLRQRLDELRDELAKVAPEGWNAVGIPPDTTVRDPVPGSPAPALLSDPAAAPAAAPIPPSSPSGPAAPATPTTPAVIIDPQAAAAPGAPGPARAPSAEPPAAPLRQAPTRRRPQRDRGLGEPA
ncbi:MAG: hypothetical protein C0468_04130 [Planctomyces sp.]|nr:hypothetical protein [Planctomyces sp.]